MTHLEKMRKIAEKAKGRDYDDEAGHQNADNILCDLLIDLGHKEIVELFHSLPKWYA